MDDKQYLLKVGGFLAALNMEYEKRCINGMTRHQAAIFYGEEVISRLAGDLKGEMLQEVIRELHATRFIAAVKSSTGYYLITLKERGISFAKAK
ncbi:MAG: hypothetical protein ACK5MW_02545 [Enterococcus sp.]